MRFGCVKFIPKAQFFLNYFIECVSMEEEMKFDVLTLFPEMFDCLKQSIIGRAVEKELIDINLINIRDFSTNKHKKVDDTPYGGGSRHGNAARCCI